MTKPTDLDVVTDFIYDSPDLNFDDLMEIMAAVLARFDVDEVDEAIDILTDDEPEPGEGGGASVTFTVSFTPENISTTVH